MKIRMKHNHALVEEVPDNRLEMIKLDYAYGHSYARKGRRDGQWDVFMADH